MRHISGVYCIKNKLNSKVYIGFSKDIKTRLWNHFCELDKGINACTRLQNDWDGNRNNWSCLTLEETTDKDREKFWTDHYNSTNPDFGYNIYRGNEIDSETRKKMKYIPSKETIDKRRQKILGRKASDETKSKLSEAQKGRKFSETHKLKLSLSRRKNSCLKDIQLYKTLKKPVPQELTDKLESIQLQINQLLEVK